MLALRNETTESLLRLYSELPKELSRRGLLRSNNNPANDYSEAIAIRALGLTLAGKSQKGHDATDAGGLRYQIKSRRLTSPNGSRELGIFRDFESRPFDRLVGVLFDVHFRVFRACVVPFEVVKSRVAFNEYTNGHKYHLRDEVWSKPGVVDVTALFIATSAEVCKACDRPRVDIESGNA